MLIGWTLKFSDTHSGWMLKYCLFGLVLVKNELSTWRRPWPCRFGSLPLLVCALSIDGGTCTRFGTRLWALCERETKIGHSDIVIAYLCGTRCAFDYISFYVVNIVELREVTPIYWMPYCVPRCVMLWSTRTYYSMPERMSTQWNIFRFEPKTIFFNLYLGGIQSILLIPCALLYKHFALFRVSSVTYNWFCYPYEIICNILVFT